MMNLKLYEDLRDILRAPWVGTIKESSKKPFNVDTVQVNDTSETLATNIFAGRRQKMMQSQQQLQQQDTQDLNKIRKDMLEW